MQSLVLGTAQFGDAYGVTNARGRLAEPEIAEIMEQARRLGVTAIDTAAGYGDAQWRLRPWAANLAITTKVAGAIPATIEHELTRSLELLGVPRVRACLLHDWSSLEPRVAAEAAAALRRAQESGLVELVGISAYDERDLELATQAFADLQIAQVPVNVLDQRLCDSGVVRELQKAGTRFQARSVFLQGLLANPDADTALAKHADVIAFREAARERSIAPLRAALSFIRTQAWIAEVVVGVTSARELTDLAAAWNQPIEIVGDRSDDLDLIDPRRW